MTLDEVKRDLEAKRLQLVQYERGLMDRADDDVVSNHARTIAHGRIQQIEMDIRLVSKIDQQERG